MKTFFPKTDSFARLALGSLLASALMSNALATPYASGISQSGNTVSFVLNQNAAAVEVLRDGGNPVYPGTAPGSYNFDMTGFSTYQIKVIGNEAPGWQQYIADQTSTSFYTPLGVSVNKIPSSPDFGAVYVSNATTGTTAYGRDNPEGIYKLRADGLSITSGTAGVTWGGSSGPWKSTVGPDGNLYVTDFSTDLAYEVKPDLSSAVQLINAGNKTSGQYVSSIHVEGTQAEGNRKIYLVNANYNDNARKGLVGYNLGGNSTVADGDTGTQIVGPTYFAFYPNDVARDSKGDWYLNQYRYDPTQAPAISKFDGSLAPPINSALWEVDKAAPFNGAYDIDINEAAGLIAYGNYYDGWVQIFDMETGEYVDGFDAGNRIRALAFDAAGNLITTDNLTEWARFWSPGGYSEALTRWDGTTLTFALVPEPGALSFLTLGALALFLRRRR